MNVFKDWRYAHVRHTDNGLNFLSFSHFPSLAITFSSLFLYWWPVIREREKRKKRPLLPFLVISHHGESRSDRISSAATQSPMVGMDKGKGGYASLFLYSPGLTLHGCFFIKLAGTVKEKGRNRSKTISFSLFLAHAHKTKETNNWAWDYKKKKKKEMSLTILWVLCRTISTLRENVRTVTGEWMPAAEKAKVVSLAAGM